ncbi:protein AIR1 [Asparagus officinalis]|uniref:protein AIR1 n=1 Tax=Asparagus officinalis TaxID=4686 RepID=UPI00098DE25B|nr:protein AIR1 [Asparagus officinalis]
MGGRSRRPPAKRANSDSNDGHPSKSVILLSSTDDEEANKDLSLEIVERAKERESKRKRAMKDEVVSVPSDSFDDIEVNFDEGEVEGERKSKKKKKKAKAKNKKKEIGAVPLVEDVDAAVKEDEPIGTADSVVTEVNEVPDNAVLRKLLRGPRYFDPVERNSSACFNCGEEGHAAANCTSEKRKKPCFICGMFGHIAKRCTQGQDCFICKRRGHIAKNCPEKNKHISQDCVICLRCGNLGHEMLSCKNDYAPEDLKEIQCYVCKNFGHLCCVDFVDNSPREVSCYNCSQTGHTGLGCAKRRGEMTDVSTSSTVCFKCGEEGHFARGCTNNLKFDRWESGSSTPWRPTDENRESLGFRSVPNEFGKPRKNKKKTFYYEDDFEDRWNTSSSKSKIKGGWIVDDPDEISRRSHEKANRWKSHTSPTTKSHKSYSKTSSGYYSTPQSPFSKQKSFMGTPNSHAASRHHSRHSNGYSTPRHYGRSQGYYDRT